MTIMRVLSSGKITSVTVHFSFLPNLYKTGNENWEFDDKGYMKTRHASINDVPIKESERLFHWDQSGPRPEDQPGLTELGL